MAQHLEQNQSNPSRVTDARWRAITRSNYTSPEFFWKTPYIFTSSIRTNRLEMKPENRWSFLFIFKFCLCSYNSLERKLEYSSLRKISPFFLSSRKMCCTRYSRMGRTENHNNYPFHHILVVQIHLKPMHFPFFLSFIETSQSQLGATEI